MTLLEDNSIENLATFGQIAQQCNAASYGMSFMYQ